MHTSNYQIKIQLSLKYVLGHLVHLPTTFIRDFSLWAWSRFEERGRTSWHPKLPGDFVGCISFPKTLIKAKITNDRFQICVCVFPDSDLVLYLQTTLSILLKSFFLNPSLLCCNNIYI